jgi:hypothetical protein
MESAAGQWRIVNNPLNLAAFYRRSWDENESDENEPVAKSPKGGQAMPRQWNKTAQLMVDD